MFTLSSTNMTLQILGAIINPALIIAIHRARICFREEIYIIKWFLKRFFQAIFKSSKTRRIIKLSNPILSIDFLETKLKFLIQKIMGEKEKKES